MVLYINTQPSLSINDKEDRHIKKQIFNTAEGVSFECVTRYNRLIKERS